jgi:hypothetical protein
MTTISVIEHLGWESCPHVGNMSTLQLNVDTFGRHDAVTQNIDPVTPFLCQALPSFAKFFVKYNSYILELLCKIW